MIRYYIATFVTTTGEKIKLRIGKGKEKISTSAAKSALTKILNANIMLPKLGDLQSIESLTYTEINKTFFRII